MQRSVLVFVLALMVAAAAVGAFLVQAGGGPASESVAAPPSRPTRPVAPTQAPPDLAPVEAPAAAVEHDEPPGAEAARAIVEIDADAAPQGGVELLVLHGQTGNPLEGAEVRYAVTTTGEERADFRDLSKIDGWMADHGTLRRTDAGGRMRIPLPQEGGRTLVLATHGELWGRAEVRASQEDPVRLELERDADLRVQVVDGAGHPIAGAPVAIRRRHQGGWRSDHDERRTEGDDGMTVFPHVAALLSTDEDVQTSVALTALLLEDVEHPLRTDDLPREIVQLVLPPVGAVEVRAFQANGLVFGGAAGVSLGIVREGQPRELSPFSRLVRHTVAASLEQGVARFPHVALGHELEVQIRRGGSQVPTRFFGPGPGRPGETSILETVLGADHPVVRLRAVEPDGEPIRDATLRTRLAFTSRHLTNSNEGIVQTDGEGRFVIDLDGAFTAGATRRLTLYQGSERDPEAQGELDLSRTFPIGMSDLGDVVVGEGPLFVSGRVVDGSGAPVANAELVLRRRQEEDWTWWQDVWDFDHAADAGGAFEVRGTFTGAAFQLGARVDDSVAELQEFQPGRRNLLLVVRSAGAIAGSLLVDEGISTDELRIELERLSPDGDGGLSWSERRAVLERDGAFRFPRLMAGAYTVRISLEGDGEPLREVEGVQVLHGETARDPRLQAVDLRGLLHSFHFTIVRPESSERFQCNLAIGPADGDAKPQWRYFHSTEFDLVTHHGSVAVDLFVRGYRMVQLEDVHDDQVLELERGLPVRIVLRGDAPIPEPPHFIKAVLVPADSPNRGIDWGAQSFDEAREIRILAPAAGRMRVTWLIEERGGTGAAVARTARVEPDQFVEIADADFEQVVEVRLSAEQLETMLDRP